MSGDSRLFTSYGPAGLIGLFPKTYRLPRDYEALERKFLSFAQALQVRASVLDAIMWRENLAARAAAAEFWPYRNQMLVTLAAMMLMPEGVTEIMVGAVTKSERAGDLTGGYAPDQIKKTRGGATPPTVFGDGCDLRFQTGSGRSAIQHQR